MKKYIFYLLMLLLPIAAKSETPKKDLPKYYETINGLTADELIIELQNICKEKYNTKFTYDDVWDAFGKTDIINENYIWDIYSDCLYTFRIHQQGSETPKDDECGYYNREHSIPKSWFGGTTKKNSPGVDLFHIYPSNARANSLRNNHIYGEVFDTISTSIDRTSAYGTSKEIMCEYTIAGIICSQKPNVNVFEPNDEYKGDLARGILATIIKWANRYPFNLKDGEMFFSNDYSKNGLYGLTEYGVVLLLKWHREDPVSNKEIIRNNAIEDSQGDRNPFIDYPELIEYIWGEYSGNVVNINNLIIYKKN